MEEEDYSKLSIEERCVHKVWKARVSGYEDAANLFRQIDDEKSPEWNKYISLVKKFVVDSNAPAQEKGLEATLALVENCASAGKTVGDVMNGLINKCIGAPKARTKELATQLALMYIEIEKHDLVMEELVKATENKNPKIAGSAIHIMTLALQEFGAKVINISKLVKRVLALLEERDKNVREEAKALLVEMYRWMGPTLKAQLTNLKPTQVAEIEAEYEKVKHNPLKPNRLLKSQQVKKAISAEAGPQSVNSEVDDGNTIAEVDPYEFLDPVDILSQLPKTFYTQLEAKKWSERKEALEALEKLLAAAPKIENADYSELVKTLKKVIQKDSNVVVVGVAIKCITGLANGLKKKFHQYSAMMMPCLFEKFKEKKQNVVLALREAVDAVYLSTNLELILEDVIVYLDNKNPSVKSEVASFLARVFSKSTPSILNKKILKQLSKSMIKTLNDQDQTVRENAAQAIGTAMKVAGEKTISPFIADVDSQKLAKIKECCEKAEVLVKVTKPAETRAVAASSAVSRPPKKTVVEERPSTATITKGPSVSKITQAASTSSLKVIEPSACISKENALQLASQFLPPNILSGLKDDEQKTLSVYQQLKKFMETESCTDVLGQIIITFVFSADVNDCTNGELLAARCDVIKYVMETICVPQAMLEDIALDASYCLSYKQSAQIACDILYTLAETFTLDLISKILLTRDFQNQPTLWADTLNWVSNAIIKCRASVDSDFLMECGKTALSNTDPLVRNAGLALIGTVHLQVGDDAGAAKAPTPIQTIPVEETVKEIGSKSKTSAPVVPASEKIKETTEDKPRIDIGNQITEQLISELTDKSWKVRSEAVTKVHQIVKQSNQINANLGELPPVLAARISDSNSKIAVASITLVESLAVAMGMNCKQHTRIFLPALIKSIGDPKVWIRSAVLSCVNTWYETGGYKEFFEGEIFADAVKTGSPSLRAEVWNFLSVKLPDAPVRSIPKDELMACLPTLYANLEDRNADVRKNACEAVKGFMIHLGYNTMNSACENIKGNSGAQVKATLEKTRGAMPEKYLAPPKSKPGSANATASSSKQSTAKMAPGSSATITKSVKPKNARAVTSSRAKKEEEVDTGMLLQINNLKTQRVIDDHKLKTLKWNFTTPRAEFVDLLKELMISANVNKNLIANMFHNDFRFHLRAIDTLTEDLTSNDLAALTSNLDLILRWMTLRFFDTNPSVLLRGLDYLNTAFKLLISAGYQMIDYEANSFIPYLILKVGDPKDTVRNSVRALFKQISSMYPVTKQFSFVMEGIKSKNARQRSECIDQLAWLIENYGMVVCQPNPPAAIKEIAKNIADRDTTVRNAALNCVVAAYFLDGERVTKMVGQIADKDLSLLEERIKRASKKRPIASVKPLQATSSSTTIMEVIDDIPGPVQSSQQQTMNIHSPPQAHHHPSQYSDDIDVNEDTFVLSNPGDRTLSPDTYERDFDFFQNDHNVTYDVTNVVQNEASSNNGPFSLDSDIIAETDQTSLKVTAPVLESVDINFLKEPIVIPNFHPIQMALMTPTLSSYKHKNAIKWEITQIGSADVEKAVDALANIDTVLKSDQRTHLTGFVDFLIKQIVHQLTMLNQCCLPDVVTCYKANFCVILKLANYPELCAEITEDTMYKLIDTLIRLLAERRLQGLDRHEMFIRTINTLVLQCMEQSDKNNVLCALINLLYDSVNNSSVSNLYKDLVAKCLWKLNRSQAEWDSSLDYTRLLSHISTFFKDYPSSWWKTRVDDVPLRTIKTILHSMVKVRGVQVEVIARNMSEISTESELYQYIKKLIKHLGSGTGSDNVQKEKDSSSHDNSPDPSVIPKLTKETRQQLSEIFKLIGDTIETSEGLKRLSAFKKAHPEADITPFLSKATPAFQQYIEKGLAALEQQAANRSNNQSNIYSTFSNNSLQNTVLCDPINSAGDDSSSSYKHVRKHADKYWFRLQHYMERLGLPVDKRCLDELCNVSDDNKDKLDSLYLGSCTGVDNMQKEKDLSSHDYTPDPSVIPPKLTKEARQQLSEIFKLIGDTVETSEGLKRLSAFKKAHPEADITPFLSKATPAFQQYIEKGLTALGHPAANKSNYQSNISFSNNTSQNTSLCDPVNSGGDDSSFSKHGRKLADKYWFRLQHYQERLGLPVDRRCLDDLSDVSDDNKDKIDSVKQTEGNEKNTSAILLSI